MENEMLEYALLYAEHGLAVFPLAPKSKTPITKNGFKNATTDTNKIETWWSENPEAGIGIATGSISGGVCVIDIDMDESRGKNGLRTLQDWEKTYGCFPNTCVSKTGGGGFHIFFRSDEEVKCRIGILAGVDIRGDGGYVVAPPSVHQNNNKYEWMEGKAIYDIQIAKVDNNIKHLLQHDNQNPIQPYIAPDVIPQGERNGSMFKLACSLQSKGLADNAIYAAIHSENESKCNPPLSKKEIEQIVKSVLKYKKGKPIYIQDNKVIEGKRDPIFDLTEKHKIMQTIKNMEEAIEFTDSLYDRIKFNTLTNSICVFGSLPWNSDEIVRQWTNVDDSNLKSFLEKKYGFTKVEKIMDALSNVADRNKFNPIIEELEQIHRDYGAETGAIRRLLVEYIGVEDNEYNYEVMKVYMLGAISRIYNPGCKFDYTLIIYGPQGFGKSEFLRHLAINPDWFNDNFNTLDGDKAIEKLQGMWIVEMAELKALKSAKDSESFKSFLTSRSDTYRAPYARRAEQRQRMCVFAGTTNNKNVFVDKTGNRRFLPIEAREGCNTKSVFSADQKAVCEDFRKAWGEAMTLFLNANKEPALILPKDIAEIAEQMQDEFSEEDYRVGMIQKWLDENIVNKVCIPQIIEYALELDNKQISKPFRREVMDIMDNEIKGWSRAKTKDRGRARFNKYGSQIAFVRENDT